MEKEQCLRSVCIIPSYFDKIEWIYTDYMIRKFNEKCGLPTYFSKTKYLIVREDLVLVNDNLNTGVYKYLFVKVSIIVK